MILGAKRFRKTALRRVITGSAMSVMLMSGMNTPLFAESNGVTVRLESVIRGNQEQPTVLFVMPWQPIPDPQMPDYFVASEAMPSRLMRAYTPKSLTQLMGCSCSCFLGFLLGYFSSPQRIRLTLVNQEFCCCHLQCHG
ncbi:MAG: hypothetical protein P8176_11890 [Gammaproteobacteria bacterium]